MVGDEPGSLISILQRYLKQTNLDTEEAHRRAGPVDNAGLQSNSFGMATVM
jgi:hypothetical protein